MDVRQKKKTTLGFLGNECSARSKPASLEWAVLLVCVNAAELLQNYTLSLVCPPQTVLQCTVTLFVKTLCSSKLVYLQLFHCQCFS